MLNCGFSNIGFTYKRTGQYKFSFIIKSKNICSLGRRHNASQMIYTYSQSLTVQNIVWTCNLRNMLKIAEDCFTRLFTANHFSLAVFSLHFLIFDAQLWKLARASYETRSSRSAYHSHSLIGTSFLPSIHLHLQFGNWAVRYWPPSVTVNAQVHLGFLWSYMPSGLFQFSASFCFITKTCLFKYMYTEKLITEKSKIFRQKIQIFFIFLLKT